LTYRVYFKMQIPNRLKKITDVRLLLQTRPFIHITISATEVFLTYCVRSRFVKSQAKVFTLVLTLGLSMSWA